MMIRVRARVLRHALEPLGLAEEAGDGAVELSERRDAREQPAVAHAALADVARVDVAHELEAGYVAHALAAPRLDGRAAPVAAVAEAVRKAVGATGGKLAWLGLGLGLG